MWRCRYSRSWKAFLFKLVAKDGILRTRTMGRAAIVVTIPRQSRGLSFVSRSKRQRGR
jgi:hypothetical protein